MMMGAANLALGLWLPCCGLDFSRSRRRQQQQHVLFSWPTMRGLVVLSWCCAQGLRLPGVTVRRALDAAVVDVGSGGLGPRGPAGLLFTRVARPAVTAWRFTRPHTFVGTALCVPALHAYAAPSLG